MPAGAGSSGPPKAICLKWQQGALTIAAMSLAIKMSGTVNLEPGPVKFYTIQGLIVSDFLEVVRISGSGHMKGSNFYFSLSGSNWIEGISAHSGNIRMEVRQGGEWDSGNYTLVETPCSEVPLP